MFDKAKMLKGYTLNIDDGEIGKVKEFYFDDQHWAVRDLVATRETGLGQAGLISPYALVAVNKQHQNISIELTKKQIEDSPSLSSDEPAPAIRALRLWVLWISDVFGRPIHVGNYSYIVRDREKWRETPQNEKHGDPHLRSTRDVTGHHIRPQTVSWPRGGFQDR